MSQPFQHDHSAGESAPVPTVHKSGVLRRWASATLFEGAREIIIEHAGVEYRLRLTNQDKLILTK